MRSFREHTGIVAPLGRSNIDTDQIIPKQFLKRIERTGYGEFLFYDWRYDSDGKPCADFPLNQPSFIGASILVAGKNFGCGSSREHAAWALTDFGFRVILAVSFADIFANNAANNGILLVSLAEQQIQTLVLAAQQSPPYRLHVSLLDRRVRDDQGFDAGFEIDEFRRVRLLDGLDEIGVTLKYAKEIDAYERGLART